VSGDGAAAPHVPAAAPAPRVPWARAAAAAWAPALGQTPQTGFVLDTLAASLQESTARSYGRHWDSFVAWCGAQADSPSPLPASVATVLRYLGDIGARGTVKADSLQPYLSAINAAHRDLMLPLPAVGDAVSRFRRGLANRQVAAGRPAARVYLPARVVCSALQWALQASPSSLLGARALPFRAAVALVLNYVWFARADTGAALRCCDIDTSNGIALVNVREKGKSHRAVSRVIRIPRGALPDVERLLHKSEAFRGSRPAESSYTLLFPASCAQLRSAFGLGSLTTGCSSSWSTSVSERPSGSRGRRTAHARAPPALRTRSARLWPRFATWADGRCAPTSSLTTSTRRALRTPGARAYLGGLRRRHRGLSLWTFDLSSYLTPQMLCFAVTWVCVSLKVGRAECGLAAFFLVVAKLQIESSCCN